MEHLNSSDVLSFHALFTLTRARPNPGAHFVIDPAHPSGLISWKPPGCPPPRGEPFPRVCCARVLGWDTTSHIAPPGASICTFPNLRKVFVCASSRPQRSVWRGFAWPLVGVLVSRGYFPGLESPASLQPPEDRLLWASL